MVVVAAMGLVTAMKNPSVACVMLVNGRPEMTARARKAYQSQTYTNKTLVEFKSGSGRTIGELRNTANAFAAGSDIIIHWDSDDWSYPKRIEEQVYLLQTTGAACVGYRSMLFWDEVHRQAWEYQFIGAQSYALGTSMCYWRDAWLGNKFPDQSEGCDDLYYSGRVKIYAEDAITGPPRMIASIHGGNTCSRIDRNAKEWKRSPEWDSYCKEKMKL
jgi:hypothetical protein